MHENDECGEDRLHEEHKREETRLHEAHVQEEAALHKVEEELHQRHVEEEEALRHAHETEEDEDRKHSGDLDVTVRTPIHSWTTSFPKETTVAEVLTLTLHHFSDLAPAAYELWRADPEEVLNPSRSLESYCIRCGEVLKLIPSDGGGQ